MFFHQVFAYASNSITVVVVFSYRNLGYACLHCELGLADFSLSPNALLCFNSLTRWHVHASSASLDRKTKRPCLIVYDNSRYVGFWLVIVEMCAVVDEDFVLWFATKPWPTETYLMHVSGAFLPSFLLMDWWIVLLCVSFSTHMYLLMHCAISAALELNTSRLWYYDRNALGRLPSVRRDSMFPNQKHSQWLVDSSYVYKLGLIYSCVHSGPTLEWGRGWCNSLRMASQANSFKWPAINPA